MTNGISMNGLCDSETMENYLKTVIVAVTSNGYQKSTIRILSDH